MLFNLKSYYKLQETGRNMFYDILSQIIADEMYFVIWKSYYVSGLDSRYPKMCVLF